MGIQDDAVATCAAYRVTENGQTWYFTTSPGEELMDAAQTLRRYCTSTEHSTGKFISLYLQAQPITPEEYQNLMRLRMENTGKVTGVFDLDFDKREFSAVHIMDGWTTWAMRDVSTAAYRAVQKQYASEDGMWRKLLDHLNGKELTSAGHLTAQNFSFSDEIMIENGKLNFYVQADFDVDAAFGTFVCTDENNDWLNIYANYDIAQDRPCDTLELNLCKGDGTEENWSYRTLSGNPFCGAATRGRPAPVRAQARGADNRSAKGTTPPVQRQTQRGGGIAGAVPAELSCGSAGTDQATAAGGQPW